MFLFTFTRYIYDTLHAQDRSCMAQFAITGVYGSGASYLAEHIALVDKQKHMVFGAARWHGGISSLGILNQYENIRIIECDLLDISSIIRFLEISNPECIFHLASFANVKAAFDTPLSTIYNNVMSTANLFEAIKILQLKPRIILCSTSEVYGKVSKSDVPIKENQKINPVSPYAASKVAQEAIGNSYFHSFDFDVVTTRMFTYLNPRRNDLFASHFAKQILEIKNNKSSKLYHGNLNSVRTILDVRDAINAYWLSYKFCKNGEIYNIGGTKVFSVAQILQNLIDISKVSIAIEEDPNLIRPIDVTLQIPDTTKFRNLTGWQENYDFDNSISFLFDQIENPKSLKSYDFRYTI